MVKRVRVLDEELRNEAEVPYEQTRLARQAARSRPRLALLLALGAAAFAVEAVLARSGWLALGAVACAAVAYGAWRGPLAGVVAAAFIALLATLIPLGLMFVGERPLSDRVVMGFVVAWGVAMLPDVLTLIRDAELQHAYGRWAMRE
ncbi:MAG TPA: hypothetical protein VM582_05760 [Candidatus Thermoplasmatota archaeon]|nr:hypothetical protein [Candidatus Thermoplasmatota archaeon]